MPASKTAVTADAAKTGAMTPSRPPAAGALLGRFVQRKCDCGDKCDCGASKKPVQRQVAPGASGGDYSAGPLYSLQPDSGEPLDPETRAFMEAQFSADFSDVRIHTGPDAEARARAIGAQAFTVGNHIYFATGKYSPGMDRSVELLVHELAHVLQQREGGGAAVPAGKLEMSTPGDPSEQEADRAASDVMAGRRPRVSRTLGSAIRRAPGDVNTALIKEVTAPLIVPAEKGAGAGEQYERAAGEGRLSTIAKFTRPGTSTLRNIWKERTGWKGNDDKFVKQFSVGGDACEVDHIVELQVGGSNNSENLQILEKPNNASSGSRIKGQLETLKENNKSEYLRLKAVTVEPPVADKCLKKEKAIDPSGELLETATLKFGDTEVALPLGREIQPNVFDISGRRSQIIAGIEFSKITWPGDGSGEIAGEFVAGSKRFLKNRQKTKLTLPIAANVVDIAADSRVQDLYFPYFSDAQLTLSVRADGVYGEGRFHPSLPLLKKAEVIIRIEHGAFSGALKTAAADIDLPIPGVSITEASLEARLEEQQFSATGVLAFAVGTFARARLQADANPSGLSASGTIDFNVPGLDTAQGRVTYADSKLAGQVRIGKDKFKLPGIKSANLTVDLTETELAGRGEVQLDVPGVRRGTLAFGVAPSGDYSITGAADLAIPGLKTAVVSLTYADGDLRGAATAGFDIPLLKGADAQITIAYAHGALTGAADVQYTKGKLTGLVHLAINERGKVSGSGEIGYQITPTLTAALGVEIRENGTVKVSGEVRVPDTINLTDAAAEINKDLFTAPTIQIPIFAIPLGTRSVGLVAEIGAGLKATASIGPVQLRQVKLRASFDPSNEQSPFELAGGGELYVPAFAGLSLRVDGGIGLSLAIASATGGISLVGTFGLKGEFSAKANFAYRNQQFTLDASATLSAQPILKFDINSYVKVELSLLFTTVEVYRKDWKLASKEWGSGLRIGVRFPVHYVAGEPLQFSTDQIVFTVPDIDFKKAVLDLLPG